MFPWSTGVKEPHSRAVSYTYTSDKAPIYKLLCILKISHLYLPSYQDCHNASLSLHVGPLLHLLTAVPRCQEKWNPTCIECNNLNFCQWYHMTRPLYLSSNGPCSNESSLTTTPASTNIIGHGMTGTSFTNKGVIQWGWAQVYQHVMDKSMNIRWNDRRYL